jgi:hypothetical protein
MAQPIQEIEVPALSLRHCSIEDYCRAVQNCRHNAFWFYQDISRVFGNYRKPFQDDEGRWWLRVRQGFTWPVDLLSEFIPRCKMPWRYTFCGYQHLVPSGAESNSSLYINVLSLPGYGQSALNLKKRNKIRQGFKSCEIKLLRTTEPEMIAGMTAAWNSLVQRTGWKSPMVPEAMALRVAELLDLEGTSILVAMERATGRMAGFLISKTFGNTTTADMVAAHSEMLHCRPNDVLNYTWLRCAQVLPGVTKASHSIKSSMTKLEEFKASLGFTAQKFPAYLHARPGFLAIVRLANPVMYKRLTGEIYWDEEKANAGDKTSPTGES